MLWAAVLRFVAVLLRGLVVVVRGGGGGFVVVAVVKTETLDARPFRLVFRLKMEVGLSAVVVAVATAAMADPSETVVSDWGGGLK